MFTTAWVVIMFNAFYGTSSQVDNIRYTTKVQCEQAVERIVAMPRKVAHQWYCAEVVVPVIGSRP